MDFHAVELVFKDEGGQGKGALNWIYFGGGRRLGVSERPHHNFFTFAHIPLLEVALNLRVGIAEHFRHEKISVLP